MAYFASADGPPNEEYASLNDDDAVRPGRVHDDATSGDEALARALAKEFEDAGAPQPGTDLDEELAMSLAMAMNNSESFEEEAPPPPPRASKMAPPPPPPSQTAPRKQSSDIASVAQSMFDRLMAPFRKETAPNEKDEARRARVERAKQRIARQATQMLNVMEVVVPDFLPTENFLVMKPDGTVSKVKVPRALQHPPFYITYDGEPLMNAAPRILDEMEQNAAFVDYYRFNPIEIETEVDIIPGPRTLGGLELVSQPEGVFVKWGVFPLPPTKVRESDQEFDYSNDEFSDDDSDEYEENDILETGHIVCAGDLIVKVGDTPTTSLEGLRLQLASMRMGSKVPVRVLRRPQPIVRCPMGHIVHLDDPRAPVDAECNSCQSNFGRHHCVECGFSLCWQCHRLIYAHSKARFPRPVNNDHEFREARRSVKVNFTEADVGLKVLIYWYTTAEWWIGQIESFGPIKGHTVVYEERDGSKCREIIPDFSVREYRILTQCVLQDDIRQEYQEVDLGEPQVTSKGVDMSVAKTQPDANDLLGLDHPSEHMFEEEKRDDVLRMDALEAPPIFSGMASMPQNGGSTPDLLSEQFEETLKVSYDQPNVRDKYDDEPLLTMDDAMQEPSLKTSPSTHAAPNNQETEKSLFEAGVDDPFFLLQPANQGHVQNEDDEEGPP